MTLGALGYVGYGVESVEGTAVAPTKYLPVSSFSVEDTNDMLIPGQVRHARDNYIAMPSPYNVSGTMEMELIPNETAHLIKSAFTATVNSSSYASGGYQHTMTPASVTPYFSFESSAADVLVMRYAGMRVNTFEVKAAFGEIVTSSWGMEGIDRSKQGAPASPTYTNCQPFHFSGADVHAASGTLLTTIKDFTFSINNNWERIGTLRRTRSWKRMAIGRREVNMSLTIDFVDTAEYDRFLGATFFDVDLYMEGSAGQAGMGSNKPIFRIQTPNVAWNKVNLPINADDYLEQSVEALVVAPIGGNIATVNLINSEQTIP